MKHTTKFFALVLSVLMICSILPLTFAEGKIVASGGIDAITWTLTDDGVLTVSGSGPILDKEEYEYDDEGEVVCISKLDCLGWQVSASFEQLTEGLSYAESLPRLIDYVKTLVIEEGITEIPDDEFSGFYPRTIVLPSTLERLGGSAINAKYAESLTVNSKELPMCGGIYIPAYRNGAKPFASIDKAIDAEIDYEQKTEKISKKATFAYDIATAYAIQQGLIDDMTKPEYLAYFNEAYGKSYTKLSSCINYCLERINKYFGTSYTSVTEAIVVHPEDDFSPVQMNDELNDKINAMYDAIDISDRMRLVSFGNEECEDITPYGWLTVNAPSGSTAEEAAKKYGLPFNATTTPERVTFLTRIKVFFEKIKAYFETLFFMTKLRLGLLK